MGGSATGGTDSSDELGGGTVSPCRRRPFAEGEEVMPGERRAPPGGHG
ncbi:hypothetical protein SFR_6298 [Streptomyces sp. FR-008]|nr:hypothetical protein SFR_6298 [Streptomyces sp. FR-008]